ncbi:hypothetical protein FACS1894208_04590 [Clostridia bacterium]|nr:hypothetical protein FACS1894208_04590 [Clostridia bacterium]
MKTNLRQKLSSRKFWTAVTVWATSILGAFNIGDSTIAQVALIIGGVGARRRSKMSAKLGADAFKTLLHNNPQIEYTAGVDAYKNIAKDNYELRATRRAIPALSPTAARFARSRIC